MIEINLASNEAIDAAEKPPAVDLAAVAEEVATSPTELTTISLDETSAPDMESNKIKETEPAKKQIDESLSIVIVDDDDDDVNVEQNEPLVSPPRKSARLTAKRRDSTSENDTNSRKMTESPVPKRRSTRLNSAASQDTPPPKIRDESSAKKMPTITENVKDKAENECDHSAKNEKNKSDQALVDELAAAFVEEFID